MGALLIRWRYFGGQLSWDHDTILLLIILTPALLGCLFLGALYTNPTLSGSILIRPNLNPKPDTLNPKPYTTLPQRKPSVVSLPFSHGDARDKKAQLMVSSPWFWIWDLGFKGSGSWLRADAFGLRALELYRDWGLRGQGLAEFRV